MSPTLPETLAVLYGTVDGTTSWDTAMARIAELVRAERFTFITVTEDGSLRQDSHPFDPEGVLEFAQDYADKDVRVARVMGGRRGVLSTQDLITPEEIVRCPVHNEHYRRFPECWNTLLVAMETEKAIVAPTVQRGANRGEFDARERQLLHAVAPHIARVVHLNDLLPPATISQDGIIAAFDGLDDGIIIFDPAGIVLHMNAAARAVVAAQDGLELRNGILAASHRDSRAALRRVMTQTLRVAAGRQIDLPAPIGLRRQHSNRPLLVRCFVSPRSPGSHSIGILQLQDRPSWRLPSAETVQAATGLTAAESRLALALLEGRSVRDYAERAELSEHTVRTHLKHIRAKLGVTRQASVVAVLARLCSS